MTSARRSATTPKDAFVRAGKRYDRYVRENIADGSWETGGPEESAFLRAFDALVLAEHHKSRRNKGSM